MLDVDDNRLDATFVRTNDTLTEFTIIKEGAADSDQDNIPDAYELSNGLDRHDPADALQDNDHDGTNNLAEYLFGLSASTPDRYEWTANRNPSTGHVEVSFPTLTGRTYQVKWSSDLANWEPGSGEIIGDGNTKSWTDDGTVTGLPSGIFYRVQVVGSP